MDKNTLIAVVLSVVVITVGFMAQNVLFPVDHQAAQQTEKKVETTQAPAAAQSASPVISQALPAAAGPITGTVVPAPDATAMEQSVKVETDFFSAVFNTKGALLSSLQLKQHKDRDGLVDMIKKGSPDAGAFALAFGGADAKPVDAVFNVRKSSASTVEFYRDFQISGFADSTFRLIKRFTFKPGEYLFQVDVILENAVNQYLPLDFKGVAYTLQFGPQIGPDFTKLDPQYDFRKFIAFSDNNRHEIAPGGPEKKQYDKKTSWFGVVGKYFVVVAAPVFSEYNVSYSTMPAGGVAQAAEIFLTRPVIKAARGADTYRFYAGPKTSSFLERYNEADKNAFGLNKLNLDNAIDPNVILGWLETGLKLLLGLFYSLVPNWGVAIILVTILVKIILLPLTQKSVESTSRMQKLAPKLEELKKKHAGNPQKLNQETAELYKREGVNPMSGCLPMLLQIPIFFAMYGLFSNHFDLRGAAFIPGWIGDLSAPESIWSFSPVKLPFDLTFTDLRLLPILFVGTQIASSMFTQTPSTGSNAQMKIMMYGMPIVFFFILYNVPSGLLVYWIVMNVLTAAQQWYISDKMKRKAST